MISLIADANDPSKVTLTQTTTLYLDRLAVSVLSTEIESAILAQARKDLQGNRAVKRAIAAAATAHLMKLLGVANPAPVETPQDIETNEPNQQ